MRKILFLLAAVLGLQTFAAAQTVAFTANLANYTGTPARAYLLVTLRVPSGCVPSSATAIPVGPQKFTPAASTGAIATTLVPNTAITCGGIADTTDYLVEVYQVATESGARDKKLYGAEYKIGPGDFALAGATPVTPVPGNALYDYAIRNGNNTFIGVQNFTGATVIGLSGEKPRRFIPSGAVDGVNKDYLFGAFPADHAMFSLYLNGVLLTEDDDYTVSGTTVTMTSAPKSGDKLFAYF